MRTTMATVFDALRILQKENESFGGNFYDFATDNYLAFVGIIVGGLAVLTLAVCFLKVYCKQRYGIEICPGASGRRRNNRNDQVLEQEGFARAIQVELNEQERRLARHSERRMKYEALVKHNKMVCLVYHWRNFFLFFFYTH